MSTLADAHPAPPARSRRRPTGSLAVRNRALVAPPRIVGLDVARALAVLGMAGAHLAAVGPRDDLLDWDRPATWDAVVHGRPSLLFALLAGVSLALVSGGRRPPEAVGDLLRLRLRLMGRGVAVFAIGVGTDLLGTPVAVVLGLYGVLFVLAPLFVCWTPARLLRWAVGLVVLGPPAVSAVHLLTLHAGGSGAGLVLGYFPLTVWLAPVFVGLAVGRLGPTDPRVLRAALVGGAALMVLGEVGGRLLRGDTRAPGGPDLPGSLPYLERLRAENPVRRVIDDWTSLVPHSGGTPELLSGIGTALVVLAGCVLLGRALGARRVVLAPLAALGSMPLTGYVAHLAAIVVLMGGPRGELTRSTVAWAGLSVALVVAAWAWALARGSGPLERWVGRVADRFAG